MCVHTNKLTLLRDYMDWWITRYPTMKWMNFEEWAKERHPRVVEGTPEYYKSIATNCYYCGKEMKPGTATVDHFIPRFHGGNDDLTQNRYVICCQYCNSTKGALKPEKFLKVIGRALNTGRTVGAIEPKRLKKVYDNLSRVINEFEYKVKNPVYYKVCRKRKREILFKKAA
jgi:hypothetical protein